MHNHDPIALFQASVQRWPARPALLISEREYTYRELDELSDTMANELRAQGAEGERVLILAEKRIETYAAILGTLKAGASYVPLHPDGPRKRWEEMAARCGARLFSGLDPQLTIPPATVRRPTDEAYVLFTSGSTGGPKGVSISRANVAAYLHHQTSAFDLNEHDRFSQFFSLTFDLSVHDLFLCWGVGGCLCVPPDEPLRAATFAREARITCWFSVPSLADMLLRARLLKSGTLPDLTLGLFCGEALRSSTARAFAEAAPNARIFNLYGPTETTIAITQHLFSPHLDTDAHVSIGRPFDGHHVRIQDEELHVSGPQVGYGYVANDTATAATFISDPNDGTRWYRTGDRARQDAEGVLHHLGRIDDQVKLAGHRVEPAEVDNVISPLLPGARCLTLPVELDGALRLATFIDAPFDAGHVAAHCADHLPGYMLPYRLIQVPDWPLTAHGKTDRERLMSLAQHG